MTKAWRYLLGLLMTGCLFIGCSVDTECRTDYTARLQVVLKVDSINASHDTIAQTALPDINLWGAGQDSIWMNHQSGVSTLSLPLRVDTTCTEFVFTVGGSAENHLKVYHQNNPTFISMACGCFVYYTLDSIVCTGGLVDNIEMINATIENVAQDNARLHITLRP